MEIVPCKFAVMVFQVGEGTVRDTLISEGLLVYLKLCVFR